MLVSISATKMEPGNRVAVKYSADEFFVGTLVKETPTGWKVAYDDNGDVKLEKGTLIRLSDKMKKRKLSITKAEVAANKYVAPAKAAPTKVAVKKVLPKAVVKSPIKAKVPDPKAIRAKKAVVVMPTVKKKPAAELPVKPKVQVPHVAPTPHAEPTPKPAKVIPASVTNTASESTMIRKVGNASLFAQCQKNVNGRIRYVEWVYNKANHEYFDGKLRSPRLYMRPDRERAVGIGVWKPSSRELGISHRVFVPDSEAQAVTTIVHEMCHQAVSEIDKDYSRDAGGHGAAWISRMRQVGLDPARYVSQDDMNEMRTEDELRSDSIKKMALESTNERPMVMSRNLMPAKWFDTSDNKWHYGLAVCPSDQKSLRWAAIEQPFSNRWRKIPTTWFRELTPGEGERFTKPDFMTAGQQVAEYVWQKYLRRSSPRRKPSRGPNFRDSGDASLDALLRALGR